MKRKSLIVAALTVAALAGCKDSGGGDNGNNGGNGQNKAATEAQAVAAIKGTWTLYGSDITVDTQSTYPSTDADYVARNELYYCNDVRCALDPNTPAIEKMTARYVADENELIPVYFNTNPTTGITAENDARFTDAIATINNVIGRPVFKNMGSSAIAHHKTEAGTSLDYSSIAASGGIIFSVGTSVKIDKNQQTCGSASEAPNSMSVPRVIIDKNNHYQGDKGWVWLNLDSDDGTCLADAEIAAHELMHVLGFNDHFAGFGADGEVFGDRAKAALRTLYNNDAQLDPENLTYYHWPAK